MDKLEIRKRAQELYEDELQYAIKRDDEVDLIKCRSRAALRLGRELDGQDISGVWLGYIEGIARASERSFETDLTNGQIRMGGALRTGALRFIPADKAREKDILAWGQMRDEKLNEFIAKREHERPIEREIVDRMRSLGGDPTWLEACPEMFEAQAA